MGVLGGQLGFLYPQLLWALLLLPLLYLLIRLLPPRPQTVTFPAIGLLKHLEKRLPPPRTPPWWLMLLRLLAVALFILAFAHPIIKQDTANLGQNPMVIFVDNGWAAQQNWPTIQERLRLILAQARANNTEVFVHGTADTFTAETLPLVRAAQALENLPEIQPRPWPGRGAEVAEAVASVADRQTSYQPIWLSAGLMDKNQRDDFIAATESMGRTRVFLPARDQLPISIVSADAQQGGFAVTLYRAQTSGPRDVSVSLRDMQGNFITRHGGQFRADENTTTLNLTLPKQLQTPGYFSIDGQGHLGSWYGVSNIAGLPKVGVVGGDSTDFPLLNGFYYLEKALAPALKPDQLDVTTSGQGYDVLFVVDQPANPEALATWAENGGVLVTFADTWLRENTSAAPLLPLKLRDFPRTLEGALSWTGALGVKNATPNTPLSPLADAPMPADVKIKKQFLPIAGSGEKTWLSLTDDTPLVSGELHGAGWRVLVHVPAVATWSNLPASGLFVRLLETLSALSMANKTDEASFTFPLPAYKLLTAQTQLTTPRRGEMLKTDKQPVSAEAPPGLYGTRQTPYIHQLAPEARKLRHVSPSDLRGLTATFYSEEAQQKPLTTPLLLLALLLMAADSLLRLNLVHKRLLAQAARGAPVAIVAFVMFFAMPAAAQPLPEGAHRVQLAYIDAGNARVNNMAERGLTSLTDVLSSRTTVTPGPPRKLNPAVDEMGYYPVIFWPVTPTMTGINQQAAENIRLYVENGGLLVIDGLTDLGRARQAVQVIMNRILPFPLKALEPDHVLNRAYYLLQNQTPGRQSGTLWLEQSHRLSRVLVGAHDWLGAWAHGPDGKPLRPIPGGGEQQRAQAFQFGINVVMYGLLGDYKADQTHVETLLKRMEAR